MSTATHEHEPDKSDAKPDMTPMIDVVFQLLIFFLVTMKFKTLDMKIEAELPKDAGQARVPRPPLDPPITARLVRGAGAGQTTRVKVGPIVLGDVLEPAVWARLTDHVRRTRELSVASGKDPNDLRAEVDADPLVATGDVVRTLDALHAADIAQVTFRGTPPPR